MAARDTMRVADGIDRLGHVARADGRLSWVGDGVGGWSPVNCYLVRDGDAGLLVDTGLPAHRAHVMGQLAGPVPAEVRSLRVVLTRQIEFDSIGNAVAIMRDLPVEAVYGHMPWEGWLHHDADFGDAADVPFRRLPTTGSIEARAGGRSLEVIAPPLRLLQTAWLFDAATGTLFTSDAFGHVPLDDPGHAPVVDAVGSGDDPGLVEAGLHAKSAWLREADVEPVLEQLQAVFATHDVRTIAPGFGCVLRGRDVVARHVELVLDAIRRAPAEAAR